MGKRGSTYSAFVAGIECCAPSFHYEGVIDGNDEDLASGFEGWAVEIAWDVGGRACWTWELVSCVSGVQFMASDDNAKRFRVCISGTKAVAGFISQHQIYSESTSLRGNKQYWLQLRLSVDFETSVSRIIGHEAPSKHSKKPKSRAGGRREETHVANMHMSLMH